MKLIYTILIGLLFFGCVSVKPGDYVTYTSDEYLFMQDSFINQSMDCLELGDMKDGKLKVKYCVGRNYASKIVQGFIFENNYTNPKERLIGANITFKAKRNYVIPCSSETIDETSSGKEYINCMVPDRKFNMYAFIMSSNKDIYGELHAKVGDTHIYNGVIGKEGKELLREFYKNARHQDKEKWKKGSL